MHASGVGLGLLSIALSCATQSNSLTRFLSKKEITPNPHQPIYFISDARLSQSSLDYSIVSLNLIWRQMCGNSRKKTTRSIQDGIDSTCHACSLATLGRHLITINHGIIIRLSDTKHPINDSIVSYIHFHVFSRVLSFCRYSISTIGIITIDPTRRHL